MSGPAQFISWFYQAISFGLGLRAEQPRRFAADVVAPWIEYDVSCRPALGALAKTSPGLLPESVGEALAEDSRRAGGRNLLQLAEAAPLFRKFEEQGIRWVVIKGVDALAHIYSGPEWRRMADLDVLVHPDSIDLSLRLLESEGLVRCHTTTPVTAPGIEYARGHLHLDVHRRLSSSSVGEEKVVEELLKGASLKELYDVPVRVMEPSRALMASALLVAKDLYLPQLVRPLRMAELALTADVAGERTEVEALARLEVLGGVRVASRTRDLLAWLRSGGTPPAWLDQDYSRPAAIADGLPSRWKRLLESAALSDTLSMRAQSLAVRVVLQGLFNLSGGRLAAWKKVGE
ncbi:MAG: nucleotidyltransferase family protein [bacterium]|nr:nucleotidyltransferase family protein [bacterium]